MTCCWRSAQALRQRRRSLLQGDFTLKLSPESKCKSILLVDELCVCVSVYVCEGMSNFHSCSRAVRFFPPRDTLTLIIKTEN